MHFPAGRTGEEQGMDHRGGRCISRKPLVSGPPLARVRGPGTTAGPTPWRARWPSVVRVVDAVAFPRWPQCRPRSLSAPPHVMSAPIRRLHDPTLPSVRREAAIVDAMAKGPRDPPLPWLRSMRPSTSLVLRPHRAMRHGWWWEWEDGSHRTVTTRQSDQTVPEGKARRPEHRGNDARQDPF